MDTNLYALASIHKNGIRDIYCSLLKHFWYKFKNSSYAHGKFLSIHDHKAFSLDISDCMISLTNGKELLIIFYNEDILIYCKHILHYGKFFHKCGHIKEFLSISTSKNMSCLSISNTNTILIVKCCDGITVSF